MKTFRQDDIGRCDFIDVLEEAVLRRRAVRLTLRDGQTLHQPVVDVLTENGEDFVRLGSGGRYPVSQLESLDTLE